MKYLGPPQSGSQAGTTASRNRFGQYYRNRRAPVQPRSAPQLAVRGYLTNSSKAWAGLNDATRTAWKAYAMAHPVVDSLGSSITLTGAQMYVSVNALNQSAGIAVQSEPPSGAPVAVPFPVVLDDSAADFEIDTSAAVTGTVLAYCSPPLSAGVNFTNDYRLVSITADPLAAASLVTADQLIAKWGDLTAGQKFMFKFRTISTGNRSAYGSISTVIT